MKKLLLAFVLISVVTLTAKAQQWQNTWGPPGSSNLSLEVINGRIFMATLSGNKLYKNYVILYSNGLYISSDHGSTWTTTFPGLPSDKVETVVEHRNELYALAGIMDPSGFNVHYWLPYKLAKDSAWIPFDAGISLTQYSMSWRGVQTLCSDGDWLYAQISGMGMWVYSPGPVAVNEETSNSSYSLYPNPASGRVFVTSSVQGKQDVSLQMRSVTGAVIYSRSCLGVSGMLNEVIDIERYSKGIYFLELLTGDKREVKKIVIQ